MYMTLGPGEIFQHTHNYYSITTLVEGVVDLEMDGSRTSLVEGMPTPVDAHVSHTLINVGDSSARVNCVHVHLGVPQQPDDSR